MIPFFLKERFQISFIMLFLTRRSDHNVYNLFLTHSKHDSRNIIICLIQVQIQTCLSQITSHLLRTHTLMIFRSAKSHHIFSAPASISGLSHSGIRHTVRHNDQHILFFQLKTALMNFFLFDHTCFHRIIKEFPISDQNRIRIIKLIKTDLFSLKIQHRKGCICQIPHTAHRQSFCDRTHCLIQFYLIDDHGTEHRSRQRGKNICLHPAAQTIRKNQHMIFIIFFNFIAVST